MQFINFFSLLLINQLLIRICIFYSGNIINIGQNGLKLSTVTGRHSFICIRVFDIFYTVFAKDNTPIGLRFIRVFCNDFFVNFLSLIKLAFNAKIIGTVIQIGYNFIIGCRNCLLCSAVFTFANGLTFLNFKASAAHFTFKYRHCFLLLISYCIIFLYKFII